MQNKNPKVSYWQLERYFNILRPSIEVLERNVKERAFTVTPSDVAGLKPSKKRLIFYLESLIPPEVVLLEKIDKELDTLELPIWWRNGDTLRFAYVNNLCPELTIKVSCYLLISGS